MLWLVLVLTVMGACNDCNVGLTSLKHENDDLRSRVEKLEHRQ